MWKNTRHTNTTEFSFAELMKAMEVLAAAGPINADQYHKALAALPFGGNMPSGLDWLNTANLGDLPPAEPDEPMICEE